jgi:hypothetical protein
VGLASIADRDLAFQDFSAHFSSGRAAQGALEEAAQGALEEAAKGVLAGLCTAPSRELSVTVAVTTWAVAVAVIVFGRHEIRRLADAVTPEKFLQLGHPNALA